MTYLLIDTSTPICRMTLVRGDQRTNFAWEANRMLARNIFSYIDEVFTRVGIQYSDLDGLAVFRGPGSFTGLRIGITVANSIASARHIPIVGETGEAWQEQAIDRLVRDEGDGIVLPEYGSDARITKPRK